MTLSHEENGERLLMLLSAVYLFNIRSRHVGFNQSQTVFQTVFMPFLQNHNVEEIVNWATL